MGSPLPPPIAEAQFYHWFWILGVLTLAVTTVAVVRRLRQHLESDVDTAFPSAYYGLLRGLGALWLLDGLLQAQPLMITRFIGGFLAPLIQGQPAFLRSLIDVGIRVWGINPVVWNECSTWIQIAIGFFLLFGSAPWRRFGLWLSVIWSVVVWVGGEAMGSLFNGGSWLGGSPGSALLYLLLAVLLLQPPAFWRSSRVTKTVSYSMAGLWGLSAFLQAWPASGFWQGQTLSSYVFSMADMPQPSFISSPMYAWAAQLGSHPARWNAGLVILFALLAALWIVRPRSVVTWWITALVTLSTWWFGQDFGVLGGMGTDPNSGVVVLLVLGTYAQMIALPVLGHAVWPRLFAKERVRS